MLPASYQFSKDGNMLKSLIATLLIAGFFLYFVGVVPAMVAFLIMGIVSYKGI